MLIGDAIKKARLSAGLTQQELATKSGLSKNSIYNYENGKRSPKSKDIIEISKALGVTLIDLMDSNEFEEYTKNSHTEWLESKLISSGYSNDLKIRMELETLLIRLENLNDEGLLKTLTYINENLKSLDILKEGE